MSKRRQAYAVGYGKPPKETQFKPGQSGNPAGRPKRPKMNIASRISAELARNVKITRDGKSSWGTQREAVAWQVIQQAVKGDRKALRLLLSLNDDDQAPLIITYESELEALKQKYRNHRNPEKAIEQELLARHYEGRNGD